MRRCSAQGPPESLVLLARHARAYHAEPHPEVIGLDPHERHQTAGSGLFVVFVSVMFRDALDPTEDAT
jgi:hypothetical protein